MFEDDNNKNSKYKIETICNITVYTKKSEEHLSSLSYLIA